MKNVGKVIATIIMLPIGIVIGLIFGLILFVCSPFYTYVKIFETIWRDEDETTYY